MEWLKSLPSGVLSQWMAYDMIDPLGEQWKQTASTIQAVLTPAFANARAELPEVDVFMPEHCLRPQKKLSSVLFKSGDETKRIADKAKAVFGHRKK